MGDFSGCIQIKYDLLSATGGGCWMALQYVNNSSGWCDKSLAFHKFYYTNPFHSEPYNYSPRFYNFVAFDPLVRGYYGIDFSFDACCNKT